MKKILFILVLLVFIACEEDKPVTDNCNTNNCNGYHECVERKCVLSENRCEDKKDCKNDYQCNVDNFCINPASPCEGQKCSNHGICSVENDTPKCNCEDGYHVDGLSCLLDDPCSVIDCQDNASCEVENNKGICACNEGYTDKDGVCEINENNPCKDKICQDNASCKVKDTVAVCNCNDTFHLDGELCESNTKQVDCKDIAPDNAASTITKVEVTWSNGSWSEATNCEWKCDTDYKKDGNSCIISDPCATVDCQNNSTCEVINGEAICNCNETFHKEENSCIPNTKQVNCKDVKPDNANSTITQVEITWNDDSWSEASDCVWDCNETFHREENLCIPNTKQISCKDVAVQNSTSVFVDVEITWNSDTSSWNEPTDCSWVCNNTFHLENGACESNIKQVDCKDIAPDNAVSVDAQVEIVWSNGFWSEASNCAWNCSVGYHDENGVCESNTKQVACNDAAPNNATAVDAQVEITWSNGSWSEARDCTWNCDESYHNENNLCLSNSKRVDCKDITAPTNATQETIKVVISWNENINSWNEPIDCTWSCNENYHSEDNATCVYNTKLVDCKTGFNPENSTEQLAQVGISWSSSSSSWSEPTNCIWNCNNLYIRNGNKCVIECADYMTDDALNNENSIAYPIILSEGINSFNNLTTKAIIDNQCIKASDWYKTSLKAGDIIKVDINFVHTNGDLDLYLYLGSNPYSAKSMTITDNESLYYIITNEDIPDGQNSVETFIHVRSFGANSYNMTITLGSGCNNALDCVNIPSKPYCIKHFCEETNPCNENNAPTCDIDHQECTPVTTTEAICACEKFYEFENNQCLYCLDSITKNINNNSYLTSYSLPLNEISTTFDNLKTSDTNCEYSEDWYKIENLSVGDTVDVYLEFIHGKGDIDLAFYIGGDSFNNRVANSQTTTDDETIFYVIKSTDIPANNNSVDLYVKVYYQKNTYNMIVKKNNPCENINCGNNQYCKSISTTETECICNENYFMNTNNECINPCLEAGAPDCSAANQYCSPINLTEAECKCENNLSMYHNECVIIPSVDTCEEVELINSSGIINGSTLGMTNDYELGTESCTNYPEKGLDTVYALILNVGDKINLNLHKTSNTAHDPSLYIISDCTNNLNSCVAGSDNNGDKDETLSFTATVNDTYYIIVDSYDNTSSSYDYELRIDLIPAN